jgi:hypothetical protein
MEPYCQNAQSSQGKLSKQLPLRAFWKKNFANAITVIESGVNFTNISGASAEQLLRRAVSMLLTATTFGNNAPKYGAQCKSWDLKYAVIFFRNVGEPDQHLLRFLLYAGVFAH